MIIVRRPLYSSCICVVLSSKSKACNFKFHITQKTDSNVSPFWIAVCETATFIFEATWATLWWFLKYVYISTFLEDWNFLCGYFSLSRSLYFHTAYIFSNSPPSHYKVQGLIWFFGLDFWIFTLPEHKHHYILWCLRVQTTKGMYVNAESFAEHNGTSFHLLSPKNASAGFTQVLI